ncbi:AraC family transcriptional regulator [Sporosarcina sp. FSL K6-1522]|uniref:AraC family transcriptional regulator n=1 Tax=Sporosarcina sp. FSL K6-1522 TaxID=2921554 RepID=UPI00315AEEC2
MHTITIAKIQQHSYWNPISHFLLPEDTYPNWSVFCINEGEMEYAFPHEQGVATFGDFVICPPNMPMRRKVKKQLKFHFFQFEFLSSENTAMYTGKIQLQDEHRLHSNYKILERLAFNETTSANDQKVYILNDFFQIFAIENTEVEIDDTKINDLLIVEALEFITKNALTNINIKSLASSLGLSPVQFSRRFRSSVGMNPQDYVTSLKLRHARILLLETDDMIEDIAIQCGYSNGFYFSRIFSSKMKTSPSQFRKTHLI